MFLVPSDIVVLDNATARNKGYNSTLKDTLKEEGIDSITFPKHSPELNPVELKFNVIVQRFNSAFGSKIIENNKYIWNILGSIIDSFSPDVVRDCYENVGFKKCRLK